MPARKPIQSYEVRRMLPACRAAVAGTSPSTALASSCQLHAHLAEASILGPSRVAPQLLARQQGGQLALQQRTARHECQAQLLSVASLRQALLSA